MESNFYQASAMVRTASSLLASYDLPLCDSWSKLVIYDGCYSLAYLTREQLLHGVLCGWTRGRNKKEQLIGKLIAVFRDQIEDGRPVLNAAGVPQGIWQDIECLNYSDDQLKELIESDTDSLGVLSTGKLAKVLARGGELSDHSLSRCEELLAKVTDGRVHFPSKFIHSIIENGGESWRVDRSTVDSFVLNTQSLRRDTEPIYYIDNYHPRTSFGEYNRFNESHFTQRISKFKKGNINALYALTQTLMCQRTFNHPVPYVTVPSSTNNPESPIAMLGRRLCNSDHNCGIDASSCLIRHSPIEPMHFGGVRSMDIHRQSIRVVDQELIAGKVVLLIDDVATTGNTLAACESLLMQAGAIHVVKFALAKTFQAYR